MTEVTLELVQAKQAELAQLVASLQQRAIAAPPSVLLSVPAIDIELQAGEHYAGAVLDDDGAIVHHLVLMAAKPGKGLAWQAAMDWAASVGGTLPTRQEQALLFANCKPHLEPAWHWSSQTEGASYAWYCNFLYGGQGYSYRSAEGSAVAVRRLTP